MITQAVLSSRAVQPTLFKQDSPRRIDRVIDYFGGGRSSATTRQTAGADAGVGWRKASTSSRFDHRAK
jgi:hypothetical protein